MVQSFFEGMETVMTQWSEEPRNLEDKSLDLQDPFIEIKCSYPYDKVERNTLRPDLGPSWKTSWEDNGGGGTKQGKERNEWNR